jgi:hypothetical protein
MRWPSARNVSVFSFYGGASVQGVTMRWRWLAAAIVLLALVVIDRAYFGGRAATVMAAVFFAG